MLDFANGTPLSNWAVPGAGMGMRPCAHCTIPLPVGTARLVKSSSSTVTLAGVNSTYNGITEVQNGTLVVNKLANLGTASSLGVGGGSLDAIRLGLAGNLHRARL